MANIVEILLTVKDNASGQLNKLKTTVAGVGKAMAGMTGVGVAVAGAFKKVADEAAAYNLAMLDGATSTGIAVEEFSRIIQVSDDYRVSQEEMTRAMQMASKNGLHPNINNLAELSDKLLTIKDPTERAAEASKIFGRNWATLAPFLLSGGDTIKKNTAAISDNLAVTREETRAARQYFEAMDNLNDTIQGFSIVVGNLAVPAAVSFIEFMQKGIEAGGQLSKILGYVISGEDSVLYKETIMKAQAQESDDWYGSHKGFYDYYKSGADAAGEADEALKDLGKTELLQRAAEALMAGDTATAQHLVDLATQAGAYEEKLQATIKLLDELNGKKITAEVLLTLEQEFAGAAGRRPTELGGGGAPSQPSGGGGGEGYHHAAWAAQHPSGVDSEGRGNPYDYCYARGGQFMVGGSGSGDNQLVQFRATPGERVTVTPRGRPGGGGINVTIGTINERADLDGLLAHIRDRIRR